MEQRRWNIDPPEGQRLWLDPLEIVVKNGVISVNVWGSTGKLHTVEQADLLEDLINDCQMLSEQAGEFVELIVEKLQPGVYTMFSQQATNGIPLFTLAHLERAAVHIQMFTRMVPAFHRHYATLYRTLEKLVSAYSEATAQPARPRR